MDIPDWLDYALLDPDNPDEFPGQILYTLQSLMPDGEGSYVSLDNAADIWGRRAVKALLEEPIRALEDKGYSEGYILDARSHYDALIQWISPLRTALMRVVFSTAGERFSVEDMILNVSLLAKNGGIVAPSHYVQMDLAWAKARRVKGLWDHTPRPTPKPVPATGDRAMPLLWIGLVLSGFLGLAWLVGSAALLRKRRR